MITTRRNGNVRIENYSASNGQVAVLERPIASYNEYVNPAPEAQTDELEKAKARMQENLNRLMNYDRQTEEVASIAVEVTPTVEASPVQATVPTMSSDEDIQPTSTTMQFGDGDLDQMYKEMNSLKDDEDEKVNYRLNAKGKIAVVLFSLVTAVILALIIINTGILAKLKANNEIVAAEVSAKASYLASQSQYIDEISSPEYVLDVAENQLGMIK